MLFQRSRPPLYIRLAIVSVATGIAGWLTSAFGVYLIDSAEQTRLHEWVLTIGSAILSACSLMFLLVAIVTVIHVARTKTFSFTHAVVLFVAGCVTIAAGIEGAYPR